MRPRISAQAEHSDRLAQLDFLRTTDRHADAADLGALPRASPPGEASQADPRAVAVAVGLMEPLVQLIRRHYRAVGLG